jgi:hypothetical protein
MQGGKFVLKKLAEELFRHIVPINEGYDYLFSDVVFVPVYETSLLVTKRTIMPISLVEEKILQLLDVGVCQIDELSQILGLKRRLLDVTLADLYSKDLVAISSNACRMMTAGRIALNNLNRAEKKQDILKNVCMDGVLGNIIDSSEYELQKIQRYDDNKLKPMIPTGEVRCYVERFKEISQIFDEENILYYSEGVHPIKEELLKIDKVDSTFVKFIRIPIHVYVSSNGTDIDIVHISNKHETLLASYKDYIIDQINNKKVLKNHFKPQKLSQQGYMGEEYAARDDLKDVLKKIHYSRNKKNINYDDVAKNVLCNRRLLDGEYRDILKYLSAQQDGVELYVDNLDDWAFNSQFTSTLGENLGKAKLSIYYRNSYNLQKAKKQIEWDFKNVSEYVKSDSKYFFCWKTRDYLLYGIPIMRNVINDDSTCMCVTYYLKRRVD